MNNIERRDKELACVSDEAVMNEQANLFAAQLMLPDDEIKEYIYRGYDVQQIARAMRSDINLVAIKVAELNRQGCCFREQEFRSNFLK